MGLTEVIEPLTERIGGAWYTKSEIEHKKVTDKYFREDCEHREREDKELEEAWKILDDLYEEAQEVLVDPVELIKSKPNPAIVELNRKDYTDEELEELFKAFDEVDEEIQVRPVSIPVKIINPQPEPELIAVELIKTELTEEVEIFFEETLEPVELIQSKPEPELTIEFALEHLKTIYKKIDKMEYSEEDRSQFSKINTILIKNNISPYLRNCKKYNKIACQNDLVSLYMIDLQIHELQWIYSYHYGLQVDCEECDGLLEGIFTDPVFDQEKAMRIAKWNFEDFDGKVVYMTVAKKIKHLRLPDHIMKELSIFRSREIRTYHENILKQKKTDKDAKGEFEIEKSNIKHRLENFLKGYLPKNKFIQNADECLSIWIAIKNTGGDITKYKNISSEYEKITGIEIKPATVRDRVTFLKKALIL